MSEENPFGLDGEQDESGTDGETGAASSNLRDVRNWGRTQEKAAREAQKALEEANAKVAAFETRDQTEKVLGTLRGLGVAPDKAPEVMATLGTPEAVRSAVLEAYGTAAPADGTPDPAAPAAAPAAQLPGSEGFNPAVPGGTPPPLKTYSLTEIEDLLRDPANHEEVQKAWSEGRVERLARAKNPDGSESPAVNWLEGPRP